ncbi:MAG: hypothetical protein AB7V50_02745 [Vampirovibrionia bacterium]
MKNIFFCIILCTLLFTLLTPENFAQEKESLLITDHSIGFVKIGLPLKEVKKLAKEYGYNLQEKESNYTLSDNNKMPIIKFTVFNSHPKAKPVRTIYTTSSKFKLENGLSLIGTPLTKLEEHYSVASIYRIKPRKDAPEIVTFKTWPFKDSKIYEGYILKFKATLNKIADEYGKISPVGEYENAFCLYTSDFYPEAKIESFLIEAIEPKIKFENNKQTH